MAKVLALQNTENTESLKYRMIVENKDDVDVDISPSLNSVPRLSLLCRFVMTLDFDNFIL